MKNIVNNLLLIVSMMILTSLFVLQYISSAKLIVIVTILQLYNVIFELAIGDHEEISNVKSNQYNNESFINDILKFIVGIGVIILYILNFISIRNTWIVILLLILYNLGCKQYSLYRAYMSMVKDK